MRGSGFAGPHRAGIDALLFGEILVDTHKFDSRWATVDGIGVREKQSGGSVWRAPRRGVTGGWAGDREHKFQPCELLKVERKAEALTEMEMPIVWGNAPSCMRCQRGSLSMADQSSSGVSERPWASPACARRRSMRTRTRPISKMIARMLAELIRLAASRGGTRKKIEAERPCAKNADDWRQIERKMDRGN